MQETVIEGRESFRLEPVGRISGCHDAPILLYHFQSNGFASPAALYTVLVQQDVLRVWETNAKANTCVRPLSSKLSGARKQVSFVATRAILTQHGKRIIDHWKETPKQTSNIFFFFFFFYLQAWMKRAFYSFCFHDSWIFDFSVMEHAVPQDLSVLI